MMKEITENQFNAYVFFTRNQIVHYFGKEIKWYKNDASTILGVIRFDYTDKDYIAVVLCRNEDTEIRCIDIKDSFNNIEEAKNWLFKSVNQLEKTNDFILLQQNISKNKKNNLFNPIANSSNLDPYFNIINSQSTHTAAKTLISEIMPYFFDVDGNFIQQFQTHGFDSRLWELYLFCYFNEEGLKINRKNYAPDFYLSNGDIDIGLEAVIVGRKRKDMPSPKYVDPNFNFNEENLNKMPIRFGSPLYTKLTHMDKKGYHYWEYPHTVNRPFVIAIADFHEDLSMIWSQSALMTYLYGYRYDHRHDKNGKLIIIPEKIESHFDGDKVIPSGFFFQPNSENVSAVLSTSSGTVAKFNRIGKQCGFDQNNITMLRHVAAHDSNPNASKPIIFDYEVTEDCFETWGEGVSVYHNPNAKHPLPFEFFPSATQYVLEGEYIKSYMPNIHVYSSVTTLICKK